MSMYKNLSRYLLPPKLLRSSTFDPPTHHRTPSLPHPLLSPLLWAWLQSQRLRPPAPLTLKCFPPFSGKVPNPLCPGALPLTTPLGCLPRATPPHSDTILSIQLAPAEMKAPPPAGLLQQQCAIFRHYSPHPPLPCEWGGPAWGRRTVQPIRSHRPTFSPPLRHFLNAQLWRENATCVPFSFSCVCMCVRSVKNCKSDLSPLYPHPAPPPQPRPRTAVGCSV